MKILDAMFPRYCVSCEGEGAVLCSKCMADLSFDGPPFAYANPVIRRLICAWKYDGDREGLRALVTVLRPRLEPLRLHVKSLKVDGIVPVPLSAWKERWRGFHQARDLARLMSEMLCIPVVDVLERKHRWTAQANLSREIRRDSLKQGRVMQVKLEHEVPRSVLLIDDVVTTGATMDAAELALKEAGTEVVVRWSLARG
jgi:ComF family protein